MLSVLRHACSAIMRSAGVSRYRFATDTRWPSLRRMRAHRLVVVPLPDRDVERTGVIRTIFMNDVLIERPTSGATARDLAVQLAEVRARTRRLAETLSTEQL